MGRAWGHHGMNLKAAIRVFESFGGSIFPRRRTGELVCRHEANNGDIVVNGRRKSAPRVLTKNLKKLSELNDL
jgi:hypothetical protein